MDSIVAIPSWTALDRLDAYTRRIYHSVYGIENDHDDRQQVCSLLAGFTVSILIYDRFLYGSTSVRM